MLIVIQSLMNSSRNFSCSPFVFVWIWLPHASSLDKKNWNFVRFRWNLFYNSWQNKNLPVCWLLWRVRIPELSECFVWWTWCRGCRGRWSCSQSCHHPAGSCDSDPGSTNQKSILFWINQSEVNIVLHQPIRSQYCFVSTNQK